MINLKHITSGSEKVMLRKNTIQQKNMASKRMNKHKNKEQLGTNSRLYKPTNMNTTPKHGEKWVYDKKHYRMFS